MFAQFALFAEGELRCGARCKRARRDQRSDGRRFSPLSGNGRDRGAQGR